MNDQHDKIRDSKDNDGGVRLVRTAGPREPLPRDVRDRLATVFDRNSKRW